MPVYRAYIAVLEGEAKKIVVVLVGYLMINLLLNVPAE